uniref:Uncharacterized protein n=1 Tax=uncultured Elusimicrobia bacterium TaxID=699876 RepID=A0A650ENI4_9BACT|nr:hypothetical protein Elusimicrob2101_1440 [uncultured Elusimicrobia bacterium]
MNKFYLSFIFIFLAACAGAQTVGTVSASATRMSADTLKKRFLLKPGDPFSPALFDKAQDDLHNLRVFKKLDFSATPAQDDTVNIHIDAQDGYYIFPLAFISGGSKSAAALSLAAGNLFKQGESTFAFIGGSTDGFAASIGGSLGDDTLAVSFEKLHFDQRFYQNHWINSFGVFSTTDDEEEYTNELLNQTRTKKESLSVTYSHRFSRTVRAFIRPEYVRYSYSHNGYDSGNHNQITAGIRVADDIRQGANMGALAGYGLTDKEKSLRDLPRARSGYALGANYTAGGSWTGADYSLSKLALEAAWVVELKNRNMFIVQAKAQDAFNASFSDKPLSSELLSNLGRYDRQIRGTRGAGAGATFVYYLLRNQTGLLSLAPFYEIAYMRAGSGYNPQSGAGATLVYRLWRFPLPVGLNYTRGLEDGSNQVGFVMGGSF